MIFPSASHPMLRFLDTRGLGETAYNPGEDLAWCAGQAHLLIVVLRALDMNQAEVVDTVMTIHEQHPEWPVIVVQTALHEGYIGTAGHIQPYPYQQTPFPSEVPHALAQVLLHQRDWFKSLPAHFVPIDFTLPEDGYEPVDYGLDALWDTIETVLPKGVIGLLRGTEHHKALLDFHARLAHPHLIGYALLNVGLGAIPLAGLPLVLAVQAKLFHSIASIYGSGIDPQALCRVYQPCRRQRWCGLIGSGIAEICSCIRFGGGGRLFGSDDLRTGQGFLRVLVWR